MSNDNNRRHRRVGSNNALLLLERQVAVMAVWTVKRNWKKRET